MKDDDYIDFAIKISEDNVKAAELKRRKKDRFQNRFKLFLCNRNLCSYVLTS